MLEDVLNSYKEQANMIQWKKYNQNDLFFEYINHEHDELANNFYAGIVCRYWGYSGRLYTQCNKHVPFEQCYDTLIDAINYVLKKRVWENPDNSLYKDPTGPDKAFHIALKRQRSILLANLTAQKRKTNFNTMSIDGMHEEYNDAAEGLLDIADESCETTIENSNLVELIKTYDDLDVILLDHVCFSNWSDHRNIIGKVKKLTPRDFSYYNKAYNMKREDYFKCLLDIRDLSIKSLTSELNRVLYLVKKEVSCIG